MDTGPRSETLTAIHWYRAVLVWMAFMLVETAHGMVRELFIAPAIGGLRARSRRRIEDVEKRQADGDRADSAQEPAARDAHGFTPARLRKLGLCTS